MWNQIVAGDGPDQPWPVSRDSHSAVSLQDCDHNPSDPALMVMWGQAHSGILKDGWVFGVNAQQWRKVRHVFMYIGSKISSEAPGTIICNLSR